MRMKVAEEEFEVSGSSLSPQTFAPQKARLNRLQQVRLTGWLRSYWVM